MSGESPIAASAVSSSEAEIRMPGLANRKVVGVPATKWDWEQALKNRSRDEGMVPGVQHIALLMSTYADGDGTSIRPSVDTLVKVSGKGRASVHEALKYLRDTGWVHQVSRGAGVSRRASQYRLTIPPALS